MAQRSSRRARKQHGQGQQTLLSEFCEQFIADAQKPQHYAYMLRLPVRQLREFLGGAPTVADLNTETVNAFLESLYDDDRCLSTIRHRRKSLVRLANHAVQLGLLAVRENPRLLCLVAGSYATLPKAFSLYADTAAGRLGIRAILGDH